MTAARIADGDLAGLDALDVDALALPLFAERAQPRAVAGYADWRLCGRIARLLVSGRFKGEVSEALLMPGMGRLGVERIFLLGLGSREDALKVSFEDAVSVLAEAKARKVAFGAPLSAREEDDAVRHRVYAERFLGAVGARKAAFDEVLVLDPAARLRSQGDLLAKAARAAGLDWEA